uniref:G patch domain and ankyrin repeat-containing protein 1 n=1 Tax=Myxine glutinosa TaxID=7769 RepID=UPI00358FF9E6
MYYVRRVNFITASKEGEAWRDGERRTEEKEKGERPPTETLNGHEARTFYENLLASPGAQTQLGTRKLTKFKVSRRSKVSRTRFATNKHKLPNALSVPSSVVVPQFVSEADRQRAGHQLLRLAQDGDWKSIDQKLGKGCCDVLFCDSYGWNALMCAAFAGRADVVRHLLELGAPLKDIKDTQGRNALQLAAEAGHNEVFEMLQDFESFTSRKKAENEAASQEKRYCPQCCIEYNVDGTSHETSTIHIFNKNQPLPSTYYHIPDNNVGFRLLLKKGWDREVGLGPEGAGRKFPVKTVLKRDQAGFGFGSIPKAKVTHFGPGDAEAIQPAVLPKRKERAATLGWQAERRSEEKQRMWERQLRSYMNTCDE